MSSNGNGNGKSNGNGKAGGNGRTKALGRDGLGGSGPDAPWVGEPVRIGDLPVVTFGGRRGFPVPSLVQLQTKAYEHFLQEDVPAEYREDVGLESVLREVFPIPSYDGTMELQYLGYELGSPRYTTDECRELKVTYGRPFKIRVRLQKESPVEEDVYLGELPIMIGGGEFVVNGTERVIVTQLHRSPGVDFSVETHSGERKLHSCWLIPERGSWIELNVTKKDELAVRIDQSGKFPATALLRAMSEEYSTDADILRLFYDVKQVATSNRNFKKQVIGKHALAPLVDKDTGEIIVDALEPIDEDAAERLKLSGLETVEVLSDLDDPLILNTLLADTTESH